MLLSPFLLYLVVLFSVGATATLLRFENGAYTDVIVAFDRGFVRNKEQIHNLEKLIKVASRELYIATQGLVYFKQVGIINVTRKDMPDQADNTKRRSRFYPRADIRIVSSIAGHGTPDAFTLQAGECGEQGKFILISDSLFRNLDSENATILAARRLVQEWVRYRYGVFDELPTWGEQSFVWKRKKMSPATCADGIKGWAMTENHERCVMECERVRSNCRFFPDPKRSSGVKSSMMSLSELPNVRFFCNSSNHNRNAPSMQNRMCNSKSIMEVILEHKDFKDKRWLKTTMEGPPEETNIIWKNDTNRFLDIVFVVESSKMMDEVNGTQEVQHFIERFFEHLAPRRSRASFIKFSDESKALWKDVPVGNESRWRDDSILNVSTRVGNQSASPDINKALQLDDIYEIHNTEYLRLPKIILISTGNGNVEVERYKSWDRRDKITTIHSIVIGRNLSRKLDRVTQMHGGDSYFLGDAGSGRREPRTFNLDMAFLESLHLAVDEEEQPVVISYERFTLKSKGERYKHSFRVDHPIGRSLVVFLSPNYTRYELTGPRMNPRPEKLHQYKFGSIAKSIFVDYAEPGRWILELWQDSKQEEQHVDVLITARPRRNVLQDSWLLVHAWIANMTENKKDNGTKGRHRIYAEVKKGYQPVIDATVVATVQIIGQQDPINVTLRDNGVAPDVFKDDGIYSNFFPVTIRKAGRPIVIVRVTNEDRKAWLKKHWNNWKSTYGMLEDDDYKRAMKEFGKSKKRFSEEDFTTYSSCKERKDAERICSVRLPLHFSRAAMANSPILFPLSKDEVVKIPPAVIRDLKVVQEFMREDGFSVLLQWTSPEHPRPNMTVKAIQVFGSTDHNSMLLKKFTSANIIHTLKNISPAGDVQSLEINITKSMVEGVNGTVRNLYLALRAEDQDGNAGGMSNIAEASFERFGEGEDDQDDDELDQDDDESDQDEQEFDQDMDSADQDVEESNAESRVWVKWTIGASVSVMGVMLIGVVACLIWRKRKASETSEEK